MKPNSRNSSGDKAISSQQSAVSKKSLSCLLCAVCCVLIAGRGCESLKKKLTRKAKPYARPSPIVNFQDYTQAMTPLDRYRKHYLLFDYWNADLLESLTRQSTNPKRIKKASAESLQELQTLQGLLQEKWAAQVTPFIAGRVRLDRRLQGELYNSSELDIIRQDLERQIRQIHRELFWRNMEDHLNAAPESAAGVAR